MREAGGGRRELQGGGRLKVLKVLKVLNFPSMRWGGKFTSGRGRNGGVGAGTPRRCQPNAGSGGSGCGSFARDRFLDATLTFLCTWFL